MPFRSANLTYMLALSLAQAALAQTTSPVVVDAPIARVGDGSNLAVNAEKLLGLHHAWKTGSSIRLNQVPLPDDRSVPLALRPVSVMPAGGTVRIRSRDGSERRHEPQVAMFSGVALDETGRPLPGSYAFLGFAGRDRPQAEGYLVVPEEAGTHTYILSSGRSPRPRGLPDVAAGPGARTCRVLNDARGQVPKRHPGGHASRHALSTSGTTVRFADLFVECDHHYRALFDSPEDAADYAVMLFGAVSDLYRRDVGVVLRIPNGYLRVWEDVPPWGSIANHGDIGNVIDYWTSPENPLQDLPRALVHVVTHPVFGGAAITVGGLCTNIAGYNVSSVNGSFDLPLEHSSPLNWDPFVVAHEIGHTCGSPHTFQYNPVIACEDGSGPDSGTIMSYCHLQYGIANVGLRFHAQVQDQIRGYVAGRDCVEVQHILPGDFDYNGVIDTLDVQAALICVNLGFAAAGCLETFDLYPADGVLTHCDHDFLARLLDPGLPIQDCNGNGVHDCDDIADGSSADCNGNGVPDACDLSGGFSGDCNDNAVPDECDADCNHNGVADDCDQAGGNGADCNGNQTLDECDLAGGTSADCNANAAPDECDIAGGGSSDCNDNLIPDECEADCNGNDAPDGCDIASGFSPDADGNGIPDECQQVRSVPAEYPTIQQAIDAADHGDTLLVAPGTYLGLNNTDLSLKGKNLLLWCDGPAGTCVIDCQQLSRGIRFEQGEGPGCAVDGFAIVNAGGIAGAGVYCQASSPTIRNCTISGSQAGAGEGGPGGPSGGGQGGGLFCAYGSPTISNCTVTGNSAQEGGGLFFIGSSATITNCVVANNHAESTGGGIHVGSSIGVTFQNCTIVNNSAVTGGGLYSQESSAVLSNALLWDNTATQDGPQLAVTGSFTSAVDVSYCNVAGGLASVLVVGKGLVQWDDSNLDIEPLLAEGYQLSSGSPCIDSGNTSAPGLAGVTADLLGNPRLVDDPTLQGSGAGACLPVDIGAVEFQMGVAVCCPEDLNADGIVDGFDLAALMGSWGPYPAPADLNGDGVVDAFDLFQLLGAWGDCD